MPREAATRDSITAFLRDLGSRYGGEGRLYLTGGSQMVFLGSRCRTEDIDYVFEATEPKQDFIEAMRTTIRDRNISAEPAGPGDFIPLPAGWRDRCRFIGRFGRIDVFLFDPVSLALCKIERGTARDIDDSIALLRLGQVSQEGLRSAFEEIFTRLETESLAVDEADYRRKFEAFGRLSAADST